MQGGVQGMDFVSDRLVLFLGWPGEESNHYVTTIGGDHECIVEEVPAGTLGKTITIPATVAKALFDALSAHYGSVGDARQLRKDYDAERGRVDVMIRSLTDRVARDTP